MARARNIKPGFFTNDRLSECEPIARLLFIGMWTIADRRGRLLDRPRKIKAEVFPYDNLEVEPLLEQLEKSGFIVRYEVDGCKCIHINNFVKHQKPHRNEADSELPEYFGPRTEALGKCPEQFGPKSEDFAPKSEHSGNGSKHLALNDERGMMNDECGKRIDERGTINTSDCSEVVVDEKPGDDGFQLSNDPPKPPEPEKEPEPIYSDAFLEWWAIYPRKECKGDAQKSFDRSIRLIGQGNSLTRSEAIQWLLTTTRRFATSKAGCKGKLTPMASTWLNQARYDDDQSQWDLDDERGRSNGRATSATSAQRFSG